MFISVCAQQCAGPETATAMLSLAGRRFVARVPPSYSCGNPGTAAAAMPIERMLLTALSTTRQLRTGANHTFADRAERKDAIASLNGWAEVGVLLAGLPNDRSLACDVRYAAVYVI